MNIGIIFPAFSQAKSIFETINIREIWMAWTEDPNDAIAADLKKHHQKRLTSLMNAHAYLSKKDKADEKNTKFLSSLTDYFSFFGENLIESREFTSSTSKTMELLKNWRNPKDPKDPQKRFLKPGEVVEHHELPGIRVYVLGPPFGKSDLNKMNPSKKNKEVYFDLGYSSFGASIDVALENRLNSTEDQVALENHLISIKDRFAPFEEKYCLTQKDIENNLEEYRMSTSWIEERLSEIEHIPEEVQFQVKECLENRRKENEIFELYQKEEWRRIEDEWVFPTGEAAIHLDYGINNTSLALAIEIIASGKILLFPGDAQVGSWLSWKNHTWLVNDGEKKKEVKINDIFARTAFYKVSHHGSHNATLKDEGLEKMTHHELIAMIPVDRDMAQRRKWAMPFDDLLKRLHEKTANKVILADEDNSEKMGELTTDLYHEIPI